MNNIILSLILEIIVTLLEIIFISCFVPLNKRRPVNYCWLIGGQVLISAVSHFLADYAIVKILINLVIVAVVMSKFFSMSLKKSFVYNAIFSAVYASIEMVVFILLYRFNVIPSYNDIDIYNGEFLVDMLASSVMLMLIVAFSSFLNKSYLSRMELNGWIIYTMYPLFTLIVDFVFLMDVDAGTSEKMIMTYTVISCGMMVLNLLLLYLLNNTIAREIRLAKDRELVENAEHIYEMYETLSEEREIQKAQAHDYRNNLNAIHSLALKGDTASLKEYIEEQLESIDHSQDAFDTGNSIVNAVLNRKYHEAEAKGILFPIVCDNLASVGISNSDLVTILSNILDNAIEAAQKCNEKKITLKIKVKDGILYIVSTNTYVEVKEDFKTTKADSDNHGYGLNNIRKAVADNGGQCYVECEEGEFRITVLIPCNKS